MEQIFDFISDNYRTMGLIALLGLFVLVAISAASGNMKFLKKAGIQWVFLIILVVSTPFMLKLLSA